MADTYELIASSTVGSGGASSIDFSSISSSFTDLIVKISARTNKTGQVDDYAKISFNGSSANQTAKYIYGLGSGSAGSYSENLIYSPADATDATANTFGNSEFYITNYSVTSNKVLSADGVLENNGTTAVSTLTAGLWSITTAINQITLTPYNGTLFLQYSTAYLYGVKKS